MANIRISSLPSEASPSASDVVPIDGATVRKTTLANLVSAGRPLASQAEAEEGTDAAKAMTPLTTAQAIASIGGAQFASSAQGALAATAVQPGDLSTVATSGDYDDLANKPMLGTAAAEDTTAFAAAVAAVPTGGSTGQVLGKVSGTDYAVQWQNAGAGDVLSVNNLSDLDDAASARSNLGLGSAAVVDLIDEDDMASDSSTAVPTQQSVKAYVDSKAPGVESIERTMLITVFQRSIPLNLWEFGATGSDNPDALVDETAEIHAAFTQAITEGRELLVPGAHYMFDRFIHTGAFKAYIQGEPANRPVFHPLQTVADATGGSGRLMQLARANYGDDPTDVIGLALSASIVPFDRFIPLVSVAGLKAGMLLQITSSELWYYDNRGTYRKGEIHLISKVLPTGVVVDDYVRDRYLTTDTLYIRAMELDEFVMNNIQFEFPLANPGSGTRSLVVDRVLKPEYNDLLFRGNTASGMINSRSWLARYHNPEFTDIGYEITGGSTGYGSLDHSTYGTIVTGLKSRGLRRAMDFETITSAQIQAVTRDVVVRDFHITGGNATAGVGEIIQAPEFDSSTGWTPDGPWVISGGKATRTGGTSGDLYAAVSGYVPGETCFITVNIISISHGLKFAFYEDTTAKGVETEFVYEPGVYTFELEVPVGANRLYAIASTSALATELESMSMQALSYFYPDGDAPNYGIGGHGSIEGIVFRDGYISDVQTGINVRNRDTEIVNVNFRGRMENCIHATFGTGLAVRDCNYRRADYPDKIPSSTAWDAAYTNKLPLAFIRLGISTGTGDWNYESLTRITGNDAHGLRDAFISLGITAAHIVKNLFVEDNVAVIGMPAGEVFDFIKVEGASGVARVGKSKIDLGSNQVVNHGAGSYRMLPDAAKMVIASQSHWTTDPDFAVQVGARQWAFTLADDTIVRLRNAAPQNERLGVRLIPHAGDGYGDVIVSPGSATLLTMGATGALLAGSATILTNGTTDGTDGMLCLYLEAATGDLYIKNRTAISRRWTVELL